MKKSAYLLFLLLLTPFALAQNDLYSMDSLQLQLNVDGSFELIPTKSNAQLQEVSADLLLYPKEDLRQKSISFDSQGIVKEDMISFFWNDKKIEKKNFGYQALIRTQNKRLKVKEKASFPLKPEETAGLEQYLEPTKTIDSDNPAIVAKAAELAQGEEDLFKVVFNLASWVEENIEYDLNTVTATASQKGSWVLQNKQGVCDEMASLFVAMARSLGIPARFVSGISYTNSQEVVDTVGSNWAGHGWAEVYFPDLGWVSFDVTFNQYGYIDVTHIKLRDGFDPTEPAVKYKWVADGVDLKKGKLDLNVKVEEEGTIVPEEVLLEQEILSHEVGFGSYNLIKGIVKNTADYYVATALNLAVPKEVEVIGRNRRNILLRPKEVRETFWIVKIPENLPSQYIYTFPAKIYSEKNISVEDSFTAQEGKNAYSKEEIEELTVQDEEKSYSRKISFDCQYQKEIKLGEENKIVCSIKNSGNANLNNIVFCVGEACETINLPINQKESAEITVKGEEIGWQKVTVSAENELVEKKISLEYAVLDQPKVKIEPNYPRSVQFGEPFEIGIAVGKESFSQPQEVVILVSGPRFGNEWKIENLVNEENLLLKMDGRVLSYSNEFVVTASWKDREGKTYSEEEEIIVVGVADSWREHLKMVSNWIINILS